MPDAGRPALVLCAHGTRDAEGRATVLALVEAVRRALPGVDVLEAYVDVQQPEVDAVVAGLPPAATGGVAGVVVPLLLAAGYHVHVDIARAVAARRDVLVTAALGPDDRLVEVLLDRLAAAGVEPGVPVVLAPAGSSDARAQADSAEMARRLAVARGAAVTLGYAGGPVPSVADSVAAARTASGGGPVAVASYLLGPGVFQRRLEQAGADVVTGPVGADRRVVEVVLARYRAALAG